MKANKMNFSNKMVFLTWLVLNLSMAYGQGNNDIAAVSPNSAMQGVTGQTITFTLDTDNPPAPPAGVIPQRVSIGSINGSAVAHPNQYIVTAVFDIPADEPAGAKDVSIAFLTPQGQSLLFFVAEGFTVIEAGESPPSITQQPRSQTVTLGSSATFTVTAWGTEPLTHQWYKDDLAISDATVSSYTIQSVGQRDEGDYYCIITNDFGSVVSDIASLAITTTPPFEGYNLFSAIGSRETYLMDNNGNFIHSWSSSYSPALSVYLLEDGTLLRTANTRNSVFDIGGAGGRVEQFNWDGDLLWNYDFSSTGYRLHHDIEILPNDNILMIAWELKTESQAIAAGRDLSLLTDGELWPDFIIEVEPTGSNGGNIVWQWHVWDHLIQEYDPTKENYGVVADHPEKINLNYVQRSGNADWNHFNSIDYNSELDQILISVHNFSEVWVIDHSTTTEEAAGSSGGNSGKGGDLLYRWGNPQAYNRGTSEDQQFFAQHDAKWIDSGLPGEGDILIFNNGQGRPAGNYSSVDQITPPLNDDGTYTIETDATYGPKSLIWTYTSSRVTDFYAERISGSQRLPNGNTLICEGTKGRFFEVTSNGAVVWEHYENGEVFRVERYSPYYTGFAGTDLEPQTRYPIVDTGQVECYDTSKAIAAPAPDEAFYGQDAQFNGNQPSYTLSDDGLTVTDNITGLIWTQTADINGDGTINVDDKFTYVEALAYPDVLNAAGYGGYNDWRLPSIKELYSLMNFAGSDPSGYNGTDTSGLTPFIDTDYYDFGYGDTAADERIIDAQFASTNLYTSTTMGGNETMFGLNLADGRIKGYPTNKLFYVYFVRGNTNYGVNNFVDNNDGTIIDEATGLMWSQNDSGAVDGTGPLSGMNWEDALAWVQIKNNENYLGYNDWRLPNAKEMQSIVDYNRSPDYTGSAAIDQIFNTTQITNEASQPDFPWFWTSTTHTPSNGGGQSGVYICFGRALGYWQNQWQDVHGAGAQRSDPKSGNPADWPTGHGPQGDAIRIYNYVRLVRDAASTQTSYPLVDTGQSACYDRDGVKIDCPEEGEAFAGQDAQYVGTPMSYTDNGNGTVTDNVTGLMWQQTPVNYGYSWQEAADYCDSLELGGYDDWRMPTVKELFSISDFSVGSPYLNTDYFDLAGAVIPKNEQYWCNNYYIGTTTEGGNDSAFGVNHGTGHIKAYPALASGHFGNYVRAVRGNASYGVNDFVDNGDSTVTDRATWLMWQQTDSGSGMDWEDALAYAESLRLAGYDDWRLPNVKEFQSIVDYTKSPSANDPNNLGPAIDTNFFEVIALAEGTTNYNPDYGYYWTSTNAYFGPDRPEYYYAWYVAFGTATGADNNDLHGAGAVRFDTKYEGGALGEGGERYYNYVRCVRDIN